MHSAEEQIAIKDAVRPRVQIVILSRDRPDYLREALRSALAAAKGLAQVLVSDNSETDAVEKLVRAEFGEFAYIRRRPPLPALEHFRVLLNDMSSEFLVLFHDDDVMMPNYVERALELLDADEGIGAVACNAMILHDWKKTTNTTMEVGAQVRMIPDVSSFLVRYMSFDGGGHPPFSSYMYRRSLLSGIYLEALDGGKHSDVTFLTKLLRRAPIKWIEEPLMWYRVHSDNDSKRESVADRLSCLRYLYKHGGLERRSSAVRDFRMGFWWRWWGRYSSGIVRAPKGWRERVVFRFLLGHSLLFVMTRSFVWRRAARKWLAR